MLRFEPSMLRFERGLPRPRHRLGEPRQRGRQLLEVGAGDSVQLSGEDAADGGLLLICPVFEHVDVMPWQPDAQLRGADDLREDAIPLGAERLFDHMQRPDLDRLGHHLRARKPLPERRRPQLDLSRPNRLGHLPPRPPEERRRLRNADMQPWL